VSQQKTLRHPATFAGIGLHSGNRVNLRFVPAPPNSGIRFRRVDLDGKPEIEARVENVSETTRSTSLAKGNIRIHTVEHVLATLAGLEIDNAVIELDAGEPPIADGSAREFTRVILEAGIETQAEQRQPFLIVAPLQLQIGETMMSAFPSEEFKLTCTSADKKGRFTQFFSVSLTPESWRQEIAQARTFCFLEEIEILIRNGLIKGGSLENAVVIRDDAVLTTEPLRYPEEFVRHKILDIIGDLSLIGRPVLGHIIAIKPNHAANCALAAQLNQQMRQPLLAAQAFTPPPASIPPAKPVPPPKPAAAEASPLPEEVALDIHQVMKLLPHRYPFLMVDRVTKIEGNRIVAYKNVTINEPFFQGHFPGHPIMPGVLQLEAMTQVAGILLLRHSDHTGKIAYFMSAEDVKWRKPVLPGDTLVISVEMTKTRGKIGRAKGVCTVNDEVVSEAEVTFMLGPA
jgi:UDP-3-O-[3-hydroxymyristoyl] N-acetylglucosamine deacetylase / 3-hydroxyacyl-[acyl-carrier-protein] dehydratase